MLTNLNHLRAGVRRVRQVGAGIVLGFGLLSASTIPAHASSTADDFEAMRQDDLRVATVAHRLATSNLASCGEERAAPTGGIILHSLGQYEIRRDRNTVARYFDLGSTAGVEAVVPGSASDIAGIKPGDQLILIGDTAAPRDDLAGKPSRTTVEQSYRLLEDRLSHGPTMLTFMRHGETRQVRLEPVSGCASEVELQSSNARNAWAEGRHIIVGGGLH